MSIKEKIGQRIKLERTSKNLTRKALAELTETLNVSRINNYERGERTPGPMEIKQLAKALDVAASYLMCLSDDRQGGLNRFQELGVLVPVLDFKQACNPESSIQEINEGGSLERRPFITIDSDFAGRLSKNAFALSMEDNSMAPELRVSDVLIIDTNIHPNPGDFVVVQLNDNPKVIIRKYKQLSLSEISSEFELIALNEDWANVQVSSAIKSKLIGVVVHLYRKIK